MLLRKIFWFIIGMTFCSCIYMYICDNNKLFSFNLKRKLQDSNNPSVSPEPHVSDIGENNRKVESLVPEQDGRSVQDYEDTTDHTEKRKMNVLFIMTDDMRTQLGCYQKAGGVFQSPRMITPNLDSLASKSILFTNAFTQYPYCGPSRASVLTGRRPDTTMVHTNNQHWRELGGNFSSLPQFFKENGYHTLSIGKIYHEMMDPLSWSEPDFVPEYVDLHLINITKGATWKAVSEEEEQKYKLVDKASVAQAKIKLQKFADNKDKPFFMALGFNKPHLSFICPKEYFDLYPLEDHQFLLNRKWQNTTEVRLGVNLINLVKTQTIRYLREIDLKQLRRAYFACISYIDALVGEVLRELEDVGLANNTVVSFVADHGYHLGENAIWGKNTMHDDSTRVPLILHIPGRTDSGIVSDNIVELLDLFPTVVEAAQPGNIVPHCPVASGNTQLCAQGRSLISKDPKEQYAISQLDLGHELACYSIRTPNFRYTEYVQVKVYRNAANVYQRQVVTNPPGFWTELYDHRWDREEVYNRTGDPEYSEVENKLRKQFLHLVASINTH